MKKVLLVEDDEHMLRMYQKLFTYGGFAVTAAADGLEGIQKAKEIKPDLIILDVMMPKMNGLELLEEIKKDKTIKHIPTVMLTNLSMEREIENALAQGASLYIIKNEHEPQKVFDMVKNLV
jgi:CheY-like chemotaxis protein